MELAVKLAGHVHLAEFLLFVDYWFDLMKTGLHDHKQKAKLQLSPCTNVNDDRIKWLTTAVPGLRFYESCFLRSANFLLETNTIEKNFGLHSFLLPMS